MPLLPGSSREVISENIREMRKAGHPEAQAVAAALHNADAHDPKKKHKKDPPKKKTARGIAIQPSHEGSLHADMHVKPGEKIPTSKIQAKLAHDKASGNVAGERKDVFALNARKWKH